MSESNLSADRVEPAPTCSGTVQIGATPATEKPMGGMRRKFAQIGHWAVAAPLWPVSYTHLTLPTILLV